MQASSGRVPRAARAWRYTASSGLPQPNSPSITITSKKRARSYCSIFRRCWRRSPLVTRAERDAAAPQAGERVGHAGEQPHAPPPAVGEARGEGGRQQASPARRARRGRARRSSSTPPSCPALALVAARIVPEPAPGARDGVTRAAASRPAGAATVVAGLAPGIVHAARVVEQRVVEIDEQSLHVSGGLLWAWSPPAGGGRGKWRQLRAAHRRGSCTSGRCGRAPSSRSRPRAATFSRDPRDTPSSSAPTAG